MTDNHLDAFQREVQALSAQANALRNALLRAEKELPAEGDAETGTLTHLAALVQSLVAKIAENTFTVAVTGEFSSGKSSLLNVLLDQVTPGKNYKPNGLLPTDIRATTATITIIGYADVPQPVTRAIMRDGARHDNLPASGIARFGAITHTATHKHDPSTEVKELHVFCRSRFLQSGVRIVDTPGLGSVVAQHRVVTKQYIPRADAVLFLMATDAPITQRELTFLQYVAEHTRHFFFVQTKSDTGQRREKNRDGEMMPQRESTQRHNEKHLREVIGKDAKLRYFVVSAKDAVQAAAEGGEDKSGLPQLRQELGAFLAQERGAKRLAGWRNALAVYAANAQQNLQVRYELTRTAGNDDEPEASDGGGEDAAETRRRYLREARDKTFEEAREAILRVEMQTAQNLLTTAKTTIERLGGAKGMLKSGIAAKAGRAEMDAEKVAQLERAIAERLQQELSREIAVVIREAGRKTREKAEEVVKDVRQNTQGSAAKALNRAMQRSGMDYVFEDLAPSVQLGDLLMSEEVEKTLTRTVDGSGNAMAGAAAGGALGLAAIALGGPLVWLGVAAVGALLGNEIDKSNRQTVTETRKEVETKVDNDLLKKQTAAAVSATLEEAVKKLEKDLDKVCRIAEAELDEYKKAVAKLRREQEALRRRTRDERATQQALLRKHLDAVAALQLPRKEIA